ncbi:phosphatidylinositol N-acetylglucosaminyltransferase subunit [Musa troglodytarum]|uniref:Phosphatidylinositol N-acetylglucosaminyltransferase subunit n=1 Tax=Musa troglodytarum TaxID=320322 RepID=A0A9E7FRI2_9LILI|nr:phosphatidylinositol N-acetylglucosaminyltransferase subunit [Musa troglodytarum]
MEETPPSPTSLVVSSPRRTLSLLRERRQKHPIPDPDEKTAASAAAAFAEEHGPKPSEVYGFVGCITTVIAAVIFMVWAYTPEPWLHSLGITYYPSKYWAIAIPSFLIVTVVLAMVSYLGLNFLVTPLPTSFNIMFDEYSRERSTVTSLRGEECPIEPISDIGVDQINNIMFG